MLASSAHQLESPFDVIRKNRRTAMADDRCFNLGDPVVVQIEAVAPPRLLSAEIAARTRHHALPCV